MGKPGDDEKTAYSVKLLTMTYLLLLQLKPSQLITGPCSKHTLENSMSELRIKWCESSVWKQPPVWKC